MIKNSPTDAVDIEETCIQSLGWKDPLEKKIAIHSSILFWKNPWTEKPGKLQSIGPQRVRHDWTPYIYQGFTSGNQSSSSEFYPWDQVPPFLSPPACTSFPKAAVQWGINGPWGQNWAEILEHSFTMWTWANYVELRFPLVTLGSQIPASLGCCEKWMGSSMCFIVRVG